MTTEDRLRAEKESNVILNQAVLVQRIQSLETENERLQEMVKGWASVVDSRDQAWVENSELQAQIGGLLDSLKEAEDEIERLQAENDNLFNDCERIVAERWRVTQEE